MKDLRAPWPLIRYGLWIWVAVVTIAMALGPLTTSKRYLVVGGLAAAIVVAVGVLLRIGRTPWPLVVVAQTFVLTGWAVFTFARSEATLGFLPNGQVLDVFRTMVDATLEHSQNYPAPVPLLTEFDTTIALCVGVVAIATDLLAASLHRAPLVGLVFLGIYMAPVSILSGDVSLWAFVPGALGFVFLLIAAERESTVGWGRDLDELTLADRSGSRGASLTSTGQRAGLTAVACAVVVPLFIPTLSPTFFGDGVGGEGDGNGSGSSVEVDSPILDLRRNLGKQSNRKLLTMTSTGAAPSYVRMTSLSRLSDNGWQPGPRGRNTVGVGGVLPASPGSSSGVARDRQRYDVRLAKSFSTRWLPVIYAPTTTTAKGPWRIDRNNLDIVTRGRDSVGDGFRYSFTSAALRPTEEQLRAATDPAERLDPMTRLPPETPRIVGERAAEVTRGARTDFDKALALQRWFRTDGGFEYDVSPGLGNGFETIARFLSDDRRGYCEQFASAMAMMARAEGIPARVAVGFLRPERDGKEYVFRGTAMHAWPELYFEGVGWTRFEPTPGGGDYRTPSFGGAPTETTPTDGASTESATPAPRSEKTSQTAAPVTGTDDSSGNGWATLAKVGGIGGLLLALAASPLLVALFLARRRWRLASTPAERVEAAWGVLRSHVRDLGIQWDPAATPRAIGQALHHRLPMESEAHERLDALVAQIEQARYAQSCDPGDVRRDVVVVVEALASGRSRWWQLRAKMVPIAWAKELQVPRFDRGRKPGGDDLITLRE